MEEINRNGKSGEKWKKSNEEKDIEEKMKSGCSEEGSGGKMWRKSGRIGETRKYP